MSVKRRQNLHRKVGYATCQQNFYLLGFKKTKNAYDEQLKDDDFVKTQGAFANQ